MLLEKGFLEREMEAFVSLSVGEIRVWFEIKRERDDVVYLFDTKTRQALFEFYLAFLLRRSLSWLSLSTRLFLSLPPLETLWNLPIFAQICKFLISFTAKTLTPLLIYAYMPSFLHHIIAYNFTTTKLFLKYKF